MNDAKVKKHFIIGSLEFLYLIFTLLPLLVYFLFSLIAIEHIVQFGRIINYGLPLAKDAENLRIHTLLRLYDILIISHMFWILLTVFLVVPRWLTISRKLAIPGLLLLVISLIISSFDPFGIWRYTID
jgi:hypothetical protein